MKIKNIEFGWVTPLTIDFSSDIAACGCTIYCFGPWYLTIFGEECRKVRRGLKGTVLGIRRNRQNPPN